MNPRTKFSSSGSSRMINPLSKATIAWMGLEIMPYGKHMFKLNSLFQWDVLVAAKSSFNPALSRFTPTVGLSGTSTRSNWFSTCGISGSNSLGFKLRQPVFYYEGLIHKIQDNIPVQINFKNGFFCYEQDMQKRCLIKISRFMMWNLLAALAVTALPLAQK